MYKNFSEVGDAREIIEQSPPKFMRVFIYYLLITLILLFSWLYVSHKEITVNTTGFIQSTSTENITPDSSGKVYEILKQESDTVEIDDVLFTYESETVDEDGNDVTEIVEIISSTGGVVHYPNGLSIGSQVYEGYEMARVIGYDTPLRVQIIVLNHDRLNIKVGQEVRVDIQALSNRDYGFAEATVTSIEADARQDQESGQSYYVGYAELKSNTLKDETILVGMQVNARMIVKEQRYLFWAIEKLELWIFE